MSHRAHASPSQAIAMKQQEADPEKALLLPKDEEVKPSLSDVPVKQYFGVSAVLFAGVCYCMAR